MKLWQKDKGSLEAVDFFTVGNDRDFDLMLAPHDITGTLAHIQMLESTGMLEKNEFKILRNHLLEILHKIHSGDFRIDPSEEDIHSQIESLLTKACGDVGKKIHAARSRNDQVLVDIKLYLRKELEEIVLLTKELFDLYIQKSEQHKDDLLPGYTHLQLAMPSSFGLWFGAYAESLVDDVITLQSAWKIVNKNPLGSAAGYGSSFPINRSMTTNLLGFEDMHHNVVYAQMTRGKTEKIVLQALSNIAFTLSKCSMDACLYMNQHFGFISFPDELTTGSSIMPHKKNPDVFELIRAHCNIIQAQPAVLQSLLQNLPSGYHRDYQLTKEITFPAILKLKECISMMQLMMSNISIKKDILKDEKFKYLFTVEEMNKLATEGMPLRDAYREIGRQVADKTFVAKGRVYHTHEGSMGNLHTKEIGSLMEQAISAFDFESVHKALKELLH